MTICVNNVLLYLGCQHIKWQIQIQFDSYQPGRVYNSFLSDILELTCSDRLIYGCTVHMHCWHSCYITVLCSSQLIWIVFHCCPLPQHNTISITVLCSIVYKVDQPVYLQHNVIKSRCRRHVLRQPRLIRILLVVKGLYQFNHPVVVYQQWYTQLRLVKHHNHIESNPI